MPQTPQKTQPKLVVPLDADNKAKVQQILKELGLSQAQVVKALWKEIERTGRVPLSFDLNDAREPTSEERRALDDYFERRKDPNYTSTSFEDALAEEED